MHEVAAQLEQVMFNSVVAHLMERELLQQEPRTPGSGGEFQTGAYNRRSCSDSNTTQLRSPASPAQ